ncbi:MAG TPA: MarR family transcriptional regulator [Myxococcota bacterium]|nr:MarR family transcriptional regulator [Myxococcota bacterium]
MKHEAALDRVLELVTLLSDDMARSFARDGLTGPRAHLLWELHHRGPSTQRALADALRVSARNITGLVDGLVDTGFVTREPHPTDRRATLVSFTERGAKTAEAMDRDHRELARLLFAGMPAKRLEGFAEDLDDILSRLRKALDETV